VGHVFVTCVLHGKLLRGGKYSEYVVGWLSTITEPRGIMSVAPSAQTP